MSDTIDYGIDLGTTNSTIACCRGGDVRLFQSTELMNVTPSVVYVSRSGRMLVGKKAYDNWVADPQNTQAEFKRWMGYSDRLTFPASGKNLSAEELSAEVLKAVRADVQRQNQESVTAAVITVPAAFGSLQCEATGRAAKLAGIEQAPLLQEPIAAAIAHGASPSAASQRWLVFDLGGGTLDIAVVSTRNGRLAVLEHQGDNRLGGKDIDRAIAEAFLLHPLSQSFSLPDARQDAKAHDRLMRGLIRQAEHAKIALSTATETTVDLFDIGDDADGKPIEATITLKRKDVDKQIEPLIDRCIGLAERALAGARVAKGDLNKILLVGGPTQMPIVRSALEARIAPRLDHSQDPMTVVARGASLYASTLERASSVTAKRSAAGSSIAVQLSYERASGTLMSPVIGTLDSRANVYEVKIDADGGFWTSGWVPVEAGNFEVEVMLNERKSVTDFSIMGRDKKGDYIAFEPDVFSVAYMLPMAAPPLPHTIAVELSTTDGVMNFDPIFNRHCPLPAEARKSYRAERTLRPSEFDATLPIKFWEIDVSDDPKERWWAGCVHIRAEKLKRPVVEGSELELTIKIDTSRKMTVEVFIPMLNESFVDGVFVPDPPSSQSQLQQQLDLCFARVNVVRRLIFEADRIDLRDRVEQMQLTLESMYEQLNPGGEPRQNLDPDAAAGPTNVLRKIRLQLSQVEEQVETGSESPQQRKVRADVRLTDRIIADHGGPVEKQEMDCLREQAERYIVENDPRGLHWMSNQLMQLRGAILDRQPWFWQNVLSYLKRPGRRFLNRTDAAGWIEKSERADESQNMPALREAVSRAWELQPPDQIEMSKEQAAQSGLRG